MTGQDFDRLFDQKTDKSYTAYLDNTKKERLFRIALIEAIEQKYQAGDKQKIYDELFGIIKTNVAAIPLSNEVIVNDVLVINIVIGLTTITVSTSGAHNLSNGNNVTINGVTGTGAAPGAINGNAQNVTVLTSTTFTMPITTTGTYTSGGVVTYNNGGLLSNYLHLLAIKTRFDKSIGTIPSATAGTPGKITITSSVLRTGMRVKISGATGMSGLNNTFYIKKVGTNKFTLYTNKALDNPATTTGSYNANTASLSVIYENWAKPLFSDRKFSPYASATISTPYYELAEKRFKIFPSDETCNYAYFDYVSAPTIFIDPTDAIVELTDTYDEKFLYYVLDTAVKLFAGPTRDQLLYQLETKELIDNP